ncbi:centaurin-gamma-1A-like [Oppia nitens]|uniref:centaurin-gamma-1A-like n=1 Tax=Oppia nitens TaxID=1686743 RepID=UPI0023D9A244|nr:centaurin-gamma-1A-like [Oppia nitens]
MKNEMSGLQSRIRHQTNDEMKHESQPLTSVTTSESMTTTTATNSTSCSNNNVTNISVNQSFYNNCLSIRQEIQRFESVHPSIYAIYDLLDLISDPLLAQQIREHVVCIEDSFVNSQEWTLSRAVPDLRLGIVGCLTSGKSALVHRYLTGSYLQDESPEGGRFKKEVIIDGHSHLLLIRDEGGPPEMQFSCWVDAVIFVFSLENETSFNTIHNYYQKMFHYRNSSDIPIFLVGTQDAISESNPRLIDDNRARKLAADLKRCSYYETCATYGLNVEKVFYDACQRIIQNKVNDSQHIITNSRPNTPSCLGFYRQFPINSTVASSEASNGIINNNNTLFKSVKTSPIHTNPPNIISTPQVKQLTTQLNNSQNKIHLNNNNNNNNSKNNKNNNIITNQKIVSDLVPLPHKRNDLKTTDSSKAALIVHKTLAEQSSNQLSVQKDTKDLPTPSSTPTTTRKTRRRSNLFPPLSNKKHLEDKYKISELGSGRTIPLKQGYLYKKSIKTLNKDWKKKYVTLTTDGRLTYHPTLHDYMEDIHGKDIPLKHITVKIPGQKPRGSRSTQPIVSPNNDIISDLNSMNLGNSNIDQKLMPITNPKSDLSSVKKRNRKAKSGGHKNSDLADDSDSYEFTIVSLENKHWYFEANSSEDRDSWVTAIEQQILSSLQNLESEKSKLKNGSSVDESAIQSIRTVPGNKYCVDCDSPNPDWTSLNLGALICIECSGIHRNLGTHISKVRSLCLDDWPAGHIAVMMALGNTTVNTIWEYDLRNRAKPTPNSSREEKERWIRVKYELKDFLAPITDVTRIEQQLVDAVLKSDIKQLSLILAHFSTKDQNISFYTREVKTPLHLAANRGSLAVIQLLLWHNPNVKAIDSDGKTALFYAKTSGHKEVAELLVQNGCTEMQAISSTNNSSSLAKRRDSLTLLTAKATTCEALDRLPASII